jgi:queuine tRNA-ribosyltransferase
MTLSLRVDGTTTGGARACTLELTHGTVQTPIFMPVGTAGTVKGMTPRDLTEIGAQICLGNTYHLYLRPGTAIVQRHGTLHDMMKWPRPILTDSGGYQVFSLESLRTITDEGVVFRSHLDGSKHHFTPESVVGIQEALGSDIAMAFDECPPSTASRDKVAAAVARTTRWAKRCLAARRRPDQAMFGIVQGGLHEDLRRAHAEELSELPFEGMAIGGLSVGETTEELHRTTELVAPMLPAHKPRYLMGVGTPEDLIAGISAGVDMFDCVLPTRNARNGKLFTAEGDISIKNSRYREDLRPLSASCRCYTCQNFSRSYLRHLFVAKEILYAHAATLHNLAYYLSLVGEARAAILGGRFEQWRTEALALRRSEPPADNRKG